MVRFEFPLICSMLSPASVHSWLTPIFSKMFALGLDVLVAAGGEQVVRVDVAVLAVADVLLLIGLHQQAAVAADPLPGIHLDALVLIAFGVKEDLFLGVQILEAQFVEVPCRPSWCCAI